MRRSGTWVVDAAGLLVVAALVVLLLLPRAEGPLGAVGGGQAPAAEDVEARELPAPSPRASPSDLAALFGWRAPVPAAPPPAPAPPEPAAATWLAAVGYVVGEGGTRSYLFKDTKQGTMVSLSPGVESKGWTLLEVRDKDYLLEYDGERYVVRQGK